MRQRWTLYLVASISLPGTKLLECSSRSSGFLLERTLSSCAFGLLVAVATANAQQPNFSKGFGGPAQTIHHDPAERAAYSSAVSQADAAARASAIQQFLLKYPDSTFRQPAIDQLAIANRESNAARANLPRPGRNAAAPSPAPVARELPANPPPQPVAPTPRESLLDHAAKHAEVTIAPRSLTIKADNSALSQILQEISRSTGMKVEGLGKDERIFGSYGPGDSREVLLSLLQGSGYNVLMVGDTATGVPRELTLSQRASAAPSASPNANQRNGQEEEEEPDQDVQQLPPPEPQQPPLINPPPQGAGQAPDNAPQPRTPQEIQQEIFRNSQQQPR